MGLFMLSYWVFNLFAYKKEFLDIIEDGQMLIWLIDYKLE